jgi:hypothetical protein
MTGDSLDLGCGYTRACRTYSKPRPQGMSRKTLNIEAGFYGARAENQSNLRGR